MWISDVYFIFISVQTVTILSMYIAHRQTKSVIRNVQNLVKITNLYTNTCIEYIKIYIRVYALYIKVIEPYTCAVR